MLNNPDIVVDIAIGEITKPCDIYYTSDGNYTVTDYADYLKVTGNQQAIDNFFNDWKNVIMTKSVTIPDNVITIITDTQTGESKKCVVIYNNLMTDYKVDDFPDHMVIEGNESSVERYLESIKDRILIEDWEKVDSKTDKDIPATDSISKEFYEIGMYADKGLAQGFEDCEKATEYDTKSDEKDKDIPVTDSVHHPNHYTSGDIECIDAIRASMTPEQFAGYCKGNCLKYIWRFEHKNQTEDIQKAQVYLTWLLNTLKGEPLTK